MNIQYKAIDKSNIHEFLQLHKTVFGDRNFALFVDIEKKCQIEKPTQNIGFIAYDDNGLPIGALGCYPFFIHNFRVRHLAAQIGDAMVLEDYRKEGVFDGLIKNVVRRCKEEGVDLVMTYPSVQNFGSYKGFVNNDFNQMGQLPTFLFDVKDGFVNRVIRKVIPSYFTSKYEKMLNSTNAPQEREGQYLSKRSDEFLESRNYSLNGWVQLSSGNVWLAPRQFTIFVGDFHLKEGVSFEELLKDLRKLARNWGKVQLKFVTNVPHEYKAIRESGYYEKNRDLAIMVHQFNQSISPLYFFNFVDLDTF